MAEAGTVYVVDDDLAVLKMLQTMLELRGLRAVAFDSPGAFLKAYSDDSPNCILLDLRLPGMGGLEVLRELRKRGHLAPVIVLTGYGDVKSAVESMKLGAVDFMEKPFERAVLVERTAKLLEVDRVRRAERSSVEQAKARFAGLTDRERELLRALMAGKSSKQIAADWGISTRTVEKHRSNLLAKTNSGNVAELVRLGSLAGFA